MAISSTCIDELCVFKNIVYMRGWKKRIPTDRLILLMKLNFLEIEGIVTDDPRVDLELAFGASARHWGFSAVFVCPTEDDALKASLAEYVIGDSHYNALPKLLQDSSLVYNNSLYERFLGAIEGHPSPSIIEIGSRSRSGNIYKHSGKGSYCGFDILAGVNVNIVGDAHKISSYFDSKFDFAVSISVWEHLAFPWIASVELAKIMRPGALAYIQSHQTWTLHDEPWDFFRFSKEAWKCLFNVKSGWEIVGAKHSLPTHIVPAFEVGNPALHFRQDHQNIGYLMSACLVRRTEVMPSLSWDICLTDLVKEIYPG